MANRFLTAERDRWPLWLAVALGAGAAGYFAGDRDVPWWAMPNRCRCM